MTTFNHDVGTQPRHKWSGITSMLAIALAFSLAGIVSFSFDLTLSEWCLGENSPRIAREILETSEAFGNGFGVTLILLTVWLLDVGNRVRFVRIVAVVLSCSLATVLLKSCVGRIRPRDFTFLNAHISDTFVGWMPILGSSVRGHSFPSAHTSTAFGLAVALAWGYPRGRVLFFTLAVLVGLQRVQVGAHFSSDACFGAAVGWLIGSILTRPGAMCNIFERLEQKTLIMPDTDASATQKSA